MIGYEIYMIVYPPPKKRIYMINLIVLSLANMLSELLCARIMGFMLLLF